MGQAARRSLVVEELQTPEQMHSGLYYLLQVAMLTAWAVRNPRLSFLIHMLHIG